MIYCHTYNPQMHAILLAVFIRVIPDCFIDYDSVTQPYAQAHPSIMTFVRVKFRQTWQIISSAESAPVRQSPPIQRHTIYEPISRRITQEALETAS